MAAKPKPAPTGAERRTAPRIEGTGAHVRLEGEEGWKSWLLAIALLPTADENEYRVANISEGGFLLRPYAGKLTKGQKFKVTLAFPEGDDMLEFVVEACVARRGAEGLGAYFVDLDAEAKAFLKMFLAQYNQGAPAKPAS